MSNFQLSILNFQLKFRQPAGTSRGVYNTRNVWYIIVTSSSAPERIGIGECAPLPGLSIDAVSGYEQILTNICREVEATGGIDFEALRAYPSILFGLETAFRHFEAGSFNLWDTPFSRGEAGIPINGLIWMGDYRKMLEQIENKKREGYQCIKLKIGAINFEEELALLKHIRSHFSANEIELRVDANGAFSPDDAFIKLQQLAELDIHSIEQPIRAKQWDEMAKLTSQTPIPIALDEELIGAYTLKEKQELLTSIHPQYIILKPSLHGGISGCNEWIQEAERLHIGWWITSALESNIGLNAIAQWCATLSNPLPQGLGTGQLFTNNIEMPLSIQKDCLWYNPQDQNTGFTKELHHFIAEWLSPAPTLTVQTSGSTGVPKQTTIRKEQMRQSALLTCSFLNLQNGDNALLCMPLQYIAGKMMVVRALVAGLNLIARTPSSHPLASVETSIQFAAMTPMQVYNTLQVPEEKEKLKQIETLIIGGGFIDQQLENELRGFPNKIYSTYGMTETLSHIALRQINGAEADSYYTPFDSVKLSLSANDTLVIEAPLVSDEKIFTNDIAEVLPCGRFKILGRIDNVINSGGIKLQIEQIEHVIRSVITAGFAITSVPHPRFGEAVVLLIDKNSSIHCSDLQENIKRILSPYEQPKYIWFVDNIPLTETSKTDRSACKRLAESLFEKENRP